jgi:hypothetical protein
MSEHVEAAPTRAEVDNRLSQLLVGQTSREEVAEWAAKWVRMANPNVEDLRVWKALTRLSAADMISTDRPYLYDKQDFDAWLRELRNG